MEDHSLDKFRVFPVELQRLTRAALQHLGLDAKSHGPLQEFLCAGHVLLAVQPLDGADGPLDRGQVQEETAAGRGQQAGAESRLFLLRSHRSVPDQLRNSAGAAGSRGLSQSERQSGAGAWDL